MLRKKRTDHPGRGKGPDSQETERGHGRVQHLHQQGGVRGWGQQRGGYGGHGGRGGRIFPQQYYDGPSEYQQGRGGQQYQAPPQHRGGIGGGHGAPAGVLFRPPAPELHQATQVPYQAGVTTHPSPYQRPAHTDAEAHSSSRPPEVTSSQVTQHIQQQVIQLGASPCDAMQPASSKSMRFPLRPGKGSYGTKCFVKANHFFAELPEKDFHHYDVSSSLPSLI